MNQDLRPAEAAQQYFPTYRIPDDARDVALHEYDLSAQALTADQRSISIATGIVVLGVGFLGTIFGSDKGLETLKDALETLSLFQEIGLFALVLGVPFVVMRYFAELQRSATHAARKIVVIRRLIAAAYFSESDVAELKQIYLDQIGKGLIAGIMSDLEFQPNG